MSEQSTAVPLNQLRRDPANVRRTDREAPPAFVASLRTKGQLVPLLVRRNGERQYLVIDGGKRLSAFQQLAKEKAIAPDHMIRVEIRDDSDLEARDTSLATAVIHDRLHPVDKYEAFAELRDGGMTPQEIAQRYGSTEKEVERALALGVLAPEVRAAWREGKLNAECAQMFTLERDKKRQADVLAKLAKQQNLYEHSIRHAIVGDRASGAKYLKFVGKDAYVAAGGAIHEDLFGENHVVSDPQLAKRLADEKLQQTCQRLVAVEGWAWAELAEALPPDASWRWARLHVAKDKYSAMQKAERGVIVELKNDGTLECEYGFEKPKKGAKATGSDVKQLAPQKKKSAGAISNSLMQRMSEWLTKATRLALPGDVDLALAALCAGFGSGKVVKVEERGFTEGHKRDPRTAGSASFETLLEQFMKLDREGKITHLAIVAGIALDLTTFNAQSPPLKDKNNAALCAAIPAKAMNGALRMAFDARNYFDSVSKGLALEAITEAINADEARKVAGKPKGDVAKFAVANVPKTGWLPKELRTANYDGPGAKAKTKPKKAVKPGKAAAKKAAAKKKAKA